MARCERATGHADPARRDPFLGDRVDGTTREDGRLVVYCPSPARWTVAALAGSAQTLTCSTCMPAVVDSMGGGVVTPGVRA